MANDVSALPDGFVLDNPSNSSAQLPEGFVLDQPQKPKKNVSDAKKYLLPKAISGAEFQPGEMNIFGDIFERPAAAVRSAIQGKGYAEGARNPQNVPSFQQMSLDAPISNRPDQPVQNFVKGIGRDALGMAADVVTNPANLLGAALGKVPTGGGGSLGEAVSATKPAQAVGRFLNKQRTGPIKFVGDTLRRGKADYLTSDVAPKAHQIFQDAVNKFTPEIENFAKSEKVPESAINTIKQYGVNDIKSTADNLGNSTDPITQRIKSGLLNKKVAADSAYGKAVDSFNGQIDSSKFFNDVQRTLRLKGFIDLRGNPTMRYSQNLDPVYKELTDMYVDMKGGVTNSGKTIAGNVMNKEDFSLYRDKLGRMLRERPSDIPVQRARNALYDSAESSGMKGIKAARDMEKGFFQAEDKFKESLFGESKLNRFHEKSFSESDRRNLQDLEKYIGNNFVNDLKKVSASKYIDKIQEGKSLDNFVKLINDAVERKNTVHVRNKLSELVGRDNASRIINEVIAHRRISIGTKAVAAGSLYEVGHKVITGRF